MSDELDKKLEEKFLSADLRVALIEGLKREGIGYGLDESQSPVLLSDNQIGWKLGPELKEAKPAASISTMFNLIEDIVEATSKYSKLSFDPATINMVRYGNEESIVTPAIVWKHIEGTPGAFGNARAGRPDARHHRPIMRAAFPDPEFADSEVFIYSQRYEHVVSLTVIANSANEADILVDWLHTAINNNIWYIKLSGIPEIYFKRREADTYRKTSNTTYYERTLVYSVTTEKYTWQREQVIKDLLVSLVKN